MSPLFDEDYWMIQRFPRVSGDEPGAGMYARSSIAFSPRERG